MTTRPISPAPSAAYFSSAPRGPFVVPNRFPKGGPLNSHDLHVKGSTGNSRGSVAGLENVLSGNVKALIEFEVEAIGATPTVSFTIQGSLDGTNFFDIAYVDPDSTVAASKTAKVVTTVGKTFVFVDGLDKRFYKRIAVNTTANTNVTFSSRLHLVHEK
jgi:hypothetical protein